MDVRLPELGEGVTAGTVVSISVAVGDHVAKEQSILELETEKAVAPVPAPAEGVVSHIHVKVGDKVSVGARLVSIEESASGSKPQVFQGAQPAARGSGQPAPQRTAEPAHSVEQTGAQSPARPGFPPAAGPAVRQLAQDLGVDLAGVKGSASAGRITPEDLKGYVKGKLEGAGAAPGGAPAKPSIDFSKWGPVTRKPLSPLRKTISEKLTEAWQTIPHVTQFDEADITALMAMKKKVDPQFEQKGLKLTVTVLVLKAVVEALAKFPIFNSSLDEPRGELVLKAYYHIGVAVDTEAGLMVPVVRDVNKKNAWALAKELAELSERARTRKVSLEDLSGGTFTVSNLGGIAGTHFTPIIRKSEVAILGIGRGTVRPTWQSGKPEARLMLPLSLSYDHRVIDGADGARFIQEISLRLSQFDEAFFTAG